MMLNRTVPKGFIQKMNFYGIKADEARSIWGGRISILRVSQIFVGELGTKTAHPEFISSPSIIK